MIPWINGSRATRQIRTSPPSVRRESALYVHICIIYYASIYRSEQDIGCFQRNHPMCNFRRNTRSEINQQFNIEIKFSTKHRDHKENTDITLYKLFNEMKSWIKNEQSPRFEESLYSRNFWQNTSWDFSIAKYGVRHELGPFNALHRAKVYIDRVKIPREF